MTYSIRKILNQLLNYMYKTLYEIHPKTFEHNDIRLLFKSAYFQIMQELDGVELIHIDEFSFNTKYRIYKGWIEKGIIDF